MEKKFCAAMYLRLSREDSEWKKENYSESNSIGNQRALILEYLCRQPDMELYDCYVDDGFSGSNFCRPGFQRMMKDAEEGNINCVIVKDLSRFGRDYIETGRYVQKIFPKLGIRFVAVTDCYDSFFADAGMKNIVLPVKNFINDSYCRDISIKVKSQLEIKRKNGEYIAPFSFYGYKKEGKNLVVDEMAAKIVRQIFYWKIEGIPVFAAAEKLNSLGVLSPAEYKKHTGSSYQSGFSSAEKAKWSSSTVKRILTNELYLGHLIQGKTEKINYKVKKSTEKPKSEWIRFENVLEPVISKRVFELAGRFLQTDCRISTSGKKRNLFSGILFCGDCREQMIRRRNCYKGKETIYEICSGSNRGEGCSRHSVGEAVLKDLILKVLQKYGAFCLQNPEIILQQKELDRLLLCCTVKKVFVYEKKKIEIIFDFAESGRMLNGKSVETVCCTEKSRNPKGTEDA